LASETPTKACLLQISLPLLLCFSFRDHLAQITTSPLVICASQTLKFVPQLPFLWSAVLLHNMFVNVVSYMSSGGFTGMRKSQTENE